MEYRIACVVVTYNRKALLKRCLDAVAQQTFPPTDTFILDNASTDGTEQSLIEWGYRDCNTAGIEFHYIRNDRNEGGAGGFHLGMKAACDKGGYDGVWVMDDDGQPDPHCLENLLPYMQSHGYVAPIVLSDEDRVSCSFASGYPDLNTFASRMSAHDGIINGFASPYNGILYSMQLLSKVGLPKRDMFIWGDEENFHFRCIKAGFEPITVMDARHFHPLNRHNYVYFLKHKLNDVSPDWKLYCYLRNAWYNKFILEDNFLKALLSDLKWFALYLLYYRSLGKTRVVIAAFRDALRKDFSRLDRYRSML